MKNNTQKSVILLVLITVALNANIFTLTKSIPTINVDPSHYELGVSPGDTQLYEITSLQILLPDGNTTNENTTSIMVGGKMKPLTLTLHDTIQVEIVNISSTAILLTQQYQLANGSIIMADPFLQNLAEFSFESYIMTTNTSLIEEAIDEAKLSTATFSGSDVYFKNVTTLSAVSGLTAEFGATYEFPSGWLESIIFETYNDTHNPLTYYELEQYTEPTPPDLFEVNPEFFTLGVNVSDEQVLEIVRIVSPDFEPDMQVGYQYRLKILNITPAMVSISANMVDLFGNSVDEFSQEVNRNNLLPTFLLTTNVSLIHEVFDDNIGFHVTYTSEYVTLNSSSGILDDTIRFEMVYDLQTGWLVSYHIKMGTGSDLTEILMVAESALTTTTSTTASQTTTEELDSKTSTSTTTVPEISSFPGFLIFLLSSFVIITWRKWRK